MKNILLIVRWPVGGIRTYIKYVFSGCEFDNSRIMVIAPNVAGFGAQFGTVFSSERFQYIPCRDSAYDLAMTVFRELKKCKFDIINVQGFTSAFSSLIPLVLAARKTPRLMTVHDVLHSAQFKGRLGVLKRWAMAQALKRYNLIIPVSNDCRDNIVKFLPELASVRMQTILNGVSVERLTSSEPAALREIPEVDEDTLLIGFMGRFMAQKGFRYLVDAVDMVVRDSNNTRKPLVLCYGIGGFYREEMAAINDRGLNGYFRLFDHVEDVGAVMKALDVVVMPSLWEACPLLPMEVLICGTPLIASDCIGLREVVADTPAWVVPQGDAVALAKALRQVAADDQRAEFAAYIPKAMARFDVARTRAQLAALYDELWVDIRP